MIHTGQYTLLNQHLTFGQLPVFVTFLAAANRLGNKTHFGPLDTAGLLFAIDNLRIQGPSSVWLKLAGHWLSEDVITIARKLAEE